MLNNELFNPSSIAVIGGSNDTSKPGGKILKNLIDGGFAGKLSVLNLKEDSVQGIKSYHNPNDLPEAELAIVAIAARFIPDTVKILVENKGTKAVIVISAGFSEENEEGSILEKQLVEIVNKAGATLIGPNCTGILTPAHHSVFTEPIPKLNKEGCVLISGSGATACFIMESGIPQGLSFSAVFSVGNSAQIGVEELVQHYDLSFDADSSSKTILLYIENIDKPQMLLKHASSLIRKGCRIAAVKAGSSEAGSRAASSHTGALASPDVAVDALFKKAGIIRCFGREDLIALASVFMFKKLNGKNIAVISHAGGPAVMLTDALEKGGLKVPSIKNEKAQQLKEALFPGSSVSNPIDFLATGTAEQLGIIIDYVDQYFDETDAMVVIFGTPGLKSIYDAYDILDKKIRTSQKPIYPVLPSLTTANNEIKNFIAKGHVFFSDEVVLGNALCRSYVQFPHDEETEKPKMDLVSIRDIINTSEDGYLSPEKNQLILRAAGIPLVPERETSSPAEAIDFAKSCGFPVVMKVVGPIHKSDVGGVILNVDNEKEVAEYFEKIMAIEDATGVLVQKMISGKELFAGMKYEPRFGHMILCGLGGIFIEVFKDVNASLAPVSKTEALEMIKNLKSFKIIEGVRGEKGLNINHFTDIIVRLSWLAVIAPEIIEMDLNPLLGTTDKIVAVDARIRISGNSS